MGEMYDINVDYDTLCNIEYRIDLILYDLSASAERMENAIQNNQGFLSGNQFEKARQTTIDCINVTRKTETNLRYAQNYLKSLEECIMEYGQYVYKGEES